MRTNEEIVRILIDEKDKKQLSLTELAKRVGMAKSAISRYFNHSREFPLNRADDFAKVLGISTEYLLGVIPEDKNSSSVVSKITAVSSKLEKKRQEKVLNYANKKLEEQESEIAEKAVHYQTHTKEIDLSKIENVIPYAPEQVGHAPVIGEIAAGFPIMAVENFEYMRPVHGKYADREDVFWLHVKGDSMETEIHNGAFALIQLCNEVPDGSIAAVLYIDDTRATLKKVYYEYTDWGTIERLRLEASNPSFPTQYADENNPAEVVGRLVKVEQDY